MQTKDSFRKEIKLKLKKGFCIYDKQCVNKLISIIAKHNKPKAYKYYRDNKLFYVKSPYKNNILLYSPLVFEVDIKCIINKFIKQKKCQVFIPKLEKTTFNMVKYRLPLIKNHWHIKEPAKCKIYNNTIVDIAIVPVLGIDKNKKRIGFGKGMYDKFYETLKVRPYSIFVSRLKSVSNYSICDWYDIQADMYVSVYR